VPLLRGLAPVLEKYDAAVDSGERLGISGITFYELQRGALDPRFSRKKAVLEALLNYFELVLPDFHNY
jgi:predicted nucleic acid-binding protein